MTYSPLAQKWTNIVPASIVFAASAWLLFQPSAPVDNSAPNWVNESDPALLEYENFQDTFGSDDVYVVALHSPTAAILLEYTRRATDVLADSPIIDKVISARTVYAERWNELEAAASNPTDDLDVLLAGPLNATLKLLDLKDGRATIFGFSPLSSLDARRSLRDRLDELRLEASENGVTARIAGNPLLNLELDQSGLDVETRSLPILVAICFVLLLALSRSLFTTLATLAPAGLTVFATEGAFGLTGLSANIVVNIAKPLLFVLILASTLHLIVAWQDGLKAGISRWTAPFEARQRKGKAVALALFTTAIGFGSLGLSPVPPIRNFGWISAGGLLMGAAILLFVLPFALMVLPPPRVREEPLTAKIAMSLAGFGMRTRGLAPFVALVVIVSGIVLALGLEADPHAIRYFDKEHPLRQDHEAIEAHGIGLATMELLIDNSSGRLDPELASNLAAFSKEIGSEDGVHAVVDFSLLARETLYQQAGVDTLDTAPGAVSQILQNAGNQFEGFTSPGNRVLRIAVLIGTLDAESLSALRRQVEAAYLEQFSAKSLEGLTITGNYELLLRTQAGLLSTLQESLVITAVIMTLLFMIFLRSVRVALVALVPNLFPVCLNFIAMSLFALPLDVGTAMTAAIALGIAVDDTLHFTLSWNPRAPLKTARTTGHAIILSSLIIGFGFLSLLTGDFAPTRNFGILCSIAMGSALVADLVILPPLLRWTTRTSQTKTESITAIEENEGIHPMQRKTP